MEIISSNFFYFIFRCLYFFFFIFHFNVNAHHTFMNTVHFSYESHQGGMKKGWKKATRRCMEKEKGREMKSKRRREEVDDISFDIAHARHYFSISATCTRATVPFFPPPLYPSVHGAPSSLPLYSPPSFLVSCSRLFDPRKINCLIYIKNK